MPRCIISEHERTLLTTRTIGMTMPELRGEPRNLY